LIEGDEGDDGDNERDDGGGADQPCPAVAAQ
jgi:hypothetical protein